MKLNSFLIKYVNYFALLSVHYFLLLTSLELSYPNVFRAGRTKGTGRTFSPSPSVSRIRNKTCAIKRSCKVKKIKKIA